MAKSIFISYSTLDIQKVNLLKKEIEATSGLIPIVIASDREPLKPLAEKVIEGIIRAAAVVPILTSNSFQTQWINQEIGFARASNKLILPIIEKSILHQLKGFIHREIDLPYIYVANPVKQSEHKDFLKQCRNIIEDLSSDMNVDSAVVETSSIVAPPRTLTAFERSLQDAARHHEEQEFNKRKRSFFNSQDGNDAIHAEFSRLVTVAEANLNRLKESSFDYETERSADGRQFIVKADRFSVSFALVKNHNSGGIEFQIWVKYWEGRITFNPNTFYIDKPRAIREAKYDSDLESPNKLCWLTPKKVRTTSEELVELALSWLVDEIVAESAKRGY